MTKMILRECLPFISFYKVDNLYQIDLVFYCFIFFGILLFFTWICLGTTQNIMFRALKPERTCKATFKFSLAISLSLLFLLPFFSFSIVQLMLLQIFFRQLLFPQLLILLLPIPSSPANC